MPADPAPAKLHRLLRSTLTGVLLLAGAACGTAPATKDASEAQVAARLAQYEAAMRRMDYDQAADLFTERGEVSHAASPPVVGREAIRSFLKSFAGFKVMQYHVVTASTQVEGGNAKQTGSFAQTVVLPQGNTVQVNGLFEASWLREAPDGPWRLARMHTLPSVAK